MKKIIITLYFSCILILFTGFSSVYCQIMTPKGDIAIGSTGADYPIRIAKTSDGGYLLVGMVNTTNTDVSGPALGGYDYWAVKTNANGQIQWNRLLGSTNNDYVADVAEDLINGGFVIVGYTESTNASGNISTPGKGGPTDIWIVKISDDGKSIIWEKRIGGNNEDYATSIVQTSSGNYLVAGFTNSSPSTGDMGNTPSRGGYDYRLITINSAGTVVWDKRLGGPGFDGTGSKSGSLTAIQTSDGGYLIAGRSFSTMGGDKSANNNGSGSDLWLIKLDASRTKQWDVALGSTDQDILASVVETVDGYVVGGTTITDDPLRGYAKNKQYFVTKLNKSGAIIWQNIYGGSADDELASLKQSIDGGFWLGGWSLSGKEGDKSEPSFGSADFWIVKLFSDGSKDFDAAFGGSAGDYLSDIIETADHGLLMAGFSSSTNSGTKTAFTKGADDFWLVKVNGIVALPVDLLFFKAQAVLNKSISLSWSTASESNNASFIVERSTDGVTFNGILQVAGAGNSKELRTYTLTDHDAIAGLSYYRLKQTDFDGKYTYSKTISIQLMNNGVADFAVFPNPSDGSQLNIALNSSMHAQDGLIRLVDMAGNTILEKHVSSPANAGVNLLEDMPVLKKGIYIVSIQNREGIIRKKVVVQ